ncbi:MAG: hydantoinase B/oxoprolinase family protein [Halobacteriales archaeon]
MSHDRRPDEEGGPTGDGDEGPTGDGGVDPVTLEVLRNACRGVAEEMNATLVRTAHSPNITDRRDCSSALFDSSGAMISQAESIPVHLGAMPHSVAAALETFPPETLAPGDAILSNDPFHGGAHLPDLTLVAPIFDGEDMVALAANRAHHADVGGANAGSIAADSSEIYAEGVRIPPVKLYEAGERNEAVAALLFANVRTPDERAGDLRAQHAANQTARERFGGLVERYGRETVADGIAAIQDYSEERMRAAITELPDGEYGFEDVLDSDGRGGEAVTIAATITVDDDRIVADFAGSDPQGPGALNAPIAVTTSATYYAVRCVTDPAIPPNAGCYRPVEIEAPAGTVVNADPPAAVVGGNLEVSQRVVDVLFGALAEAVPERVAAAGQGTMNNLTLGGVDPRNGDQFAFYETQGGGFGGRAGADGMDGVHVHMSNTRNTPAEVLETAYPLRVRRYALRPDSGGAGEFRGGLGLRRDVEARGPMRCNLLSDRRDHAPYGVAGGESGEPGADYLRTNDGGDDSGGDIRVDRSPDRYSPGTVEANSINSSVDPYTTATERLDPKAPRDLREGDVVSIRTPGGGGYGDPADRPIERVVRDLRLGKITADRAREAYGVGPEKRDESDSAD